MAATIRASRHPLVREVVFRPRTAVDPPEVIVFLRPGVTDDQAEEFWCSVVVPARGTNAEKNSPVTVWNDPGTRIMVQVPDCAE